MRRHRGDTYRGTVYDARPWWARALAAAPRVVLTAATMTVLILVLGRAFGDWLDRWTAR